MWKLLRKDFVLRICHPYFERLYLPFAPNASLFQNSEHRFEIRILRRQVLCFVYIRGVLLLQNMSR